MNECTNSLMEWSMKFALKKLAFNGSDCNMEWTLRCQKIILDSKLSQYLSRTSAFPMDAQSSTSTNNRAILAFFAANNLGIRKFTAKSMQTRLKNNFCVFSCASIPYHLSAMNNFLKMECIKCSNSMSNRLNCNWTGTNGGSLMTLK